MAAFGLMALALAAAPACTAEHAVYQLRGAEGVTGGFAKQRFQVNFASDLYFWIRTPDGRRWWFSMNSPNGYGGVFLSPDADATKITEADREAEPPPPPDDPIEVDFDSFDSDFGHLDGPPQSADPAPAHLFARGLGPLMWYNAVGAANGDKTAKATSIPIAMWDYVSCDAG